MALVWCWYRYLRTDGQNAHCYWFGLWYQFKYLHIKYICKMLYLVLKMSMSIQIYGYTIDNFSHRYEDRHWLKDFWASNNPSLLIFNWTIILRKTKICSKTIFFLLKFDFWNLEIFDVGNQQYFYYYFCVFAYLRINLRTLYE